MRRRYETVYIFDSALDEPAITEKLNRFHALLTKDGRGSITKSSPWGERPLAPRRRLRNAAATVLGQQGVKPVEFFGDCRLVQRAIKDVDRLVPTTHATSLWSWVTRCGGRHRVGDL